MKLPRVLRFAVRAILRATGLLALWTLWLLLAACLGLQLQIATTRELELPRFARQMLAQHLAEAGLKVNFSRARIDPFGHVLLENVSLGAVDQPDALATAHGVYVRLSPLPLLVGSVEVRELQVINARLLLPAMVSPTGRSEAVAEALDFTLLPDGRNFTLTRFIAQVGRFSVTAGGTVRLPRPTAPGPPAMPQLLKNYFLYASQFYHASREGLPFVTPQLDLRLEPSEEHLAIVHLRCLAGGWPATDASLAADNPARSLQCGPLQFSTTLPLLSDHPGSVVIAGFLTAPSYLQLYHAGFLQFQLHGSWSPDDSAFTPDRLDASADLVSGVWRELPIVSGPVSAAVTFAHGQPTALVANASIAGSAWNIAISPGQPEAERYHFAIAGPVNDALLAFASPLVGIDLGRFIQFPATARLTTNLTLGADGALAQIEGWISSGPLRVAGVSLKQAETRFTYAGGRLLCTDTLLRAGESEARGSYEMNSETLDFRFLLSGRLQPADIAGWFDDSWPRFWGNFGFPAIPPEAEVDVGGRWGDSKLTTLLLAANVPRAVVRDVALERVQTRVFLADNWSNVLEFSAGQGSGGVQGKFAITENPAGDSWKRLDFDATSTIGLEAAARLIGPAGLQLVAPYHFAHPPNLKLKGRMEDQNGNGWLHQQVDLSVDSQGEFEFNSFPVRDLSTQISIRDGAVDLSLLSLQAAGGTLTGSAHIWTGATGESRLRFDVALGHATLGEAGRLISRSTAALHHEPVSPPGLLEQRLAAAHLGLALAAEGTYDDLYHFTGHGKLDLTGANFEQIDLFGPLSKILAHTLLNFTSLTLDELHAEFALVGNKVLFAKDKPLLLTGPHATIKASGNYDLKGQQLDIMAEVLPFDRSRTPLGNVLKNILTPVTTVLEDVLKVNRVKLGGTLDKPVWSLVDGPTNLLRSLDDKLPLPSVPSAQPGMQN